MMDFFDELRDKFRGLVNPAPAAFQSAVAWRGMCPLLFQVCWSC